MYTNFKKHLETELQGIRDAGLYKNERIITTPQSADIKVQPEFKLFENNSVVQNRKKIQCFRELDGDTDDANDELFLFSLNHFKEPERQAADPEPAEPAESAEPPEAAVREPQRQGLPLRRTPSDN